MSDLTKTTFTHEVLEALQDDLCTCEKEYDPSGAYSMVTAQCLNCQYINEIERLNDRIKALEEGECRFHCRMRKDMWKAGGVFVFENWHKCARPADKHLEVLYRQWRKEDEMYL